MDTSKVGPGEWIAAAGGLLLLIALFFLDWYSLQPNIQVPGAAATLLAQATVPDLPQGIDVSGFDVNIGAWDGEGFLGTIANLIMLAAAAWAIVAVALKAGAGGPEQPPVDSSRLTVLLGLAATLMVALRIIFTPGDSDFVDTSLEFGIFVALIGAVGIAIGGMMSRDGAVAPAGGPPPPPAPPPSQPPAPPPSEPPPPPPPGGGQPPASG